MPFRTEDELREALQALDELRAVLAVLRQAVSQSSGRDIWDIAESALEQVDHIESEINEHLGLQGGRAKVVGG